MSETIFVEREKWLSSEAGQEALMKHAKELAALEVLRYEASVCGFDGPGGSIRLLLTYDELMDLWGFGDRNRVSEYLNWLEDHGWIKCRRTHRGKGRRTGQYLLADFDDDYNQMWFEGTVVDAE